MARILYGVSGEGAGHGVRSREVLRHLVGQGHEVRVVTYDRAYQLLRDEFQCTEVAGMKIDYAHNAIRYIPTIWTNAMKAPAVAKSLAAVSTLIEDFDPNIVCTDFEPFSTIQAIRFHLPIISIDNIHHMFYGSGRIPWRHRNDRLIAQVLSKCMVPRADEYIVTALEPVTKKWPQVTIVPPIIRPTILEAKPVSGEHVIVYDSFGSNDVSALFKSIPQTFIIYGHNRDDVDGNITFKPASEAGFLHDLYTARAVIGTAGFTLISECLVLHKPYLAIPVSHHFEQTDNALVLEELGYGQMLRVMTSSGVSKFLDEVPRLTKHLNTYHHPGNAMALAAVDKAIDTVRR